MNKVDNRTLFAAIDRIQDELDYFGVMGFSLVQVIEVAAKDNNPAGWQLFFTRTTDVAVDSGAV